MTFRRHLGVVLGILGLLVVMSLLVACDKGPECELKARAIVNHVWYDHDPLRFEAYDSVGNRYEIYVDESTIVNSGAATEFGGETKEFEWSDFRVHLQVDMWLDEIDKDKGHEPKHYIALRLDISSTPR